MRYNEFALKKLMKKEFDDLSLDERIAVDILNFIHIVYLNKQDFYSARFDTQYFGDVGMTFTKQANCLIGFCRVSLKAEDKVIDYLFTEHGFELLNEIVR